MIVPAVRNVLVVGGGAAGAAAAILLAEGGVAVELIDIKPDIGALGSGITLQGNALRVLRRLGYGEAGGGYAAEYRRARDAAAAELPATVPALRRAHQVLRRHGQTLCRRTAPECPACPLNTDCPSAGTAH